MWISLGFRNFLIPLQAAIFVSFWCLHSLKTHFFTDWGSISFWPSVSLKGNDTYVSILLDPSLRCSASRCYKSWLRYSLSIDLYSQPSWIFEACFNCNSLPLEIQQHGFLCKTRSCILPLFFVFMTTTPTCANTDRRTRLCAAFGFTSSWLFQPLKVTALANPKFYFLVPSIE